MKVIALIAVLLLAPGSVAVSTEAKANPIMKVFSIVVALYPFATAADCANGAASCVEEHDETSLVQVKKVLKQGSDRVMENSQSPMVQSGTGNSTQNSNFAVVEILASIDHCFQKRGLNLETGSMPDFDVYMHSGTAVNYDGCRSQLNDIDLWIPKMMELLPPAAKTVLGIAYEGPGVKWDFKENPKHILGFTDKGREEHCDQTYCPEEVVNGKTFKEVDAFVGVGEVHMVDGCEVYPKFDMEPFLGVSSTGIANARFVAQGIGFKLWVIGECDLVALKYALIHGGRGIGKEKPTDDEDIDCLCKKKATCAKCR